MERTKVKTNRKFLVRAQKALREFPKETNMRHWDAVSMADEELPYFVDGFSNETVVEIELPDGVIETLSELKPLVERMGVRCEGDFVAL